MALKPTRGADELKVIKTSVGSISTWGLIRELQKAGVGVIGVDSNPLSYAFYLLKRKYVVPKGSDPRYMDELMRIVEAESPAAILSGTEEELLVTSKEAGRLEEKGTILLSPANKFVQICTDKKLMSNRLGKISVPTPEVYERGAVRFPCAIKPRRGRGSLNVFRADDEEELRLYAKKVQSPLVQEFVTGDEYSVDVLADEEGEAASVVPRLRLYTESGIAVKSKTVYDAEIVEYCRRIAKSLKLFGPSCIQCIKGKEGPKFTDVNMRFGGGSILSIKADQTMIPNLIRLIRREKMIASGGFKEGLVMMRYHSEVFVEAKDVLRAPFDRLTPN